MTTTTRRLRFAAIALLVGFALAGLAPACFQPPTDDVLFACDPVEDPRCPDGYSCESDGCCHKDGTDIQASFGACGLGGNEGGTATETTGADTTGADTTDTDTTSTDTTEGTDTTSTDTGTSDTTTG